MKPYGILLLTLLGILSSKANSLRERPCPTAYPSTHGLYELCDACGCSANGGSMGFGTGLNTNFVGLRYLRQNYRSRDGIFNNSPWIDEHFNTVQLWTQVPLGNRFRVNGVLPYHSHSRTFSDRTTQHISGLGDATLLVYYQLTKQTPDSVVSITPEHTLQLGGGIKAPTGKFDLENLEGSVNPGFQLGTGSWDVLVAANYGLTYRNWGLFLTANYTFKSENNARYQFGNQLNLALNTYKTYYLGTNFVLTPQIGIGGEYFDTDTAFGLTEDSTGGHALLGKIGVEMRYRNYALGLSAMLPVAQDLNEGDVEIKNRFSLYVNLNI